MVEGANPYSKSLKCDCIFFALCLLVVSLGFVKPLKYVIIWRGDCTHLNALHVVCLILWCQLHRRHFFIYHNLPGDVEGNNIIRPFTVKFLFNILEPLGYP